MQRMTSAKVLATAAAVLGLGAAAASANVGSLTTAHVGAQHAAAAGQPTPTQILLCGTFMPGTDRFSGTSNIDHPSGSSAMGSEYPYTGQNCDSNGANSSGSFTWTIGHSNVNTATELGTEHGIAVLSTSAGQPAGFNGRITNFDFTDTPDPCGNREIYYASGHQFDPDTCSASAPGNFNTHGGAHSGDHFNGKYGTVVYQRTDTSPSNNCPSGGSTYCFEAIILGQTN